MRVRNDSPLAVPDGLFVPALRAYLGPEAMWKPGEVLELPDAVAASLVNPEHPAVDEKGAVLDVTFTTADDGTVTATVTEPPATESPTAAEPAPAVEVQPATEES